MSFSSELAEIRFGCGLSPLYAPASSTEDLLHGLQGHDDMAARYQIGDFDHLRLRLAKISALQKQAKKTSNTEALKGKVQTERKSIVKEGRQWFAQSLLRWVHTETGFRERLIGFWADHFTAKGKKVSLIYATAPYIEEAIRPHVNTTFADMLIATTLHPLMLHFLDQGKSVGANSMAASRNKHLKGLNENLAREVLELHTLGVDGPYSQTDVRQLAKLFTGLSHTRNLNFRFRAPYAEPGPETILGQSYGGDPASLGPVKQALRDLAVHPATARHIAWKLAVHFVSDSPDSDLVQHLTARFIATGGNLMALYTALLEHPASWGPTLGNVKPPADFIGSACRALVPARGKVETMKPGKVRRLMLGPLALMGQPWNRPDGPDGWAEEDSVWVTPLGVSARLRWALSVPQKLRPNLPDPRGFVDTALGSFAPPSVHFAAKAAESKSDAIGLILAAPAFQRR